MSIVRDNHTPEPTCDGCGVPMTPHHGVHRHEAGDFCSRCREQIRQAELLAARFNETRPAPPGLIRGADLPPRDLVAEACGGCGTPLDCGKHYLVRGRGPYCLRCYEARIAGKPGVPMRSFLRGPGR